jgi:hypothetical protein
MDRRSRVFGCAMVGNRWESMGSDGKRWEAMGSDGKRWESMGVDGSRWESMGLRRSAAGAQHVMLIGWARVIGLTLTPEIGPGKTKGHGDSSVATMPAEISQPATK